MKKSPFFILVFCMMFAASCDSTVGLGSPPQNTPENIFKGDSWHNQYRTVDISFTENEFTCIYGFETYTGTYSLSQEDGLPFITLSSTETRVNGKITYGQTSELIDGVYVSLPYPDVIYFLPYWNDENRGNIIIGGIFYKQ